MILVYAHKTQSSAATRQRSATANGCPQSQNCVQLLVGLQCVEEGKRGGTEREGERRERGEEGVEGAVDRRAEVALLVTYAAAGKTFWQCRVYTALAMFVDMFAKVCRGREARRKKKRGRKRGRDRRRGVIVCEG